MINAAMLPEKINAVHIRYNESLMPRFSIKTIAYWTAMVATFLGFVLSTFKGVPLWTTIVQYAMLAALVLGRCVYLEIQGDKQP